MSQHTPGAEPPLPNDVSQGWLPEDKRQTPQSPLPQPKFWGYQSLIPHKMLNALRHPGEIPWLVAAYAVTLAVYLGLLIFFIETIVSRDRYNNDLEWTSSSRYSTMSYAERVFNDYAGVPPTVRGAAGAGAAAHLHCACHTLRTAARARHSYFAYAVS